MTNNYGRTNYNEGFSYKEDDVSSREIKPIGSTGELGRVIHESFTVDNLPLTAQIAPEWIKQDELFDLAVADGTLTVIGGAH